MKPGELIQRRRRKALDRLRSSQSIPRLTTAESLCAIMAGCGPIKFHRILAARGLATPIKGFDGGYQFDLPSEYGSETHSIKHHSFHWTPKGIIFISKILAAEKISFEIPMELHRWTSEQAKFWMWQTEPGAWLKSAEKLHQASIVVWSDFAAHNDVTSTSFKSDDIAPVAIMLRGLAIETLAKGLIAIDKAEQWQHDGKIKWSGGGHNLRLLLEQCDEELARKNAKLLNRLTEYVSWRGRYAVTLSAKDDSLGEILFIRTEDWEPALELWSKLHHRLQERVEELRGDGFAPV